MCHPNLWFALYFEKKKYHIDWVSILIPYVWHNAFIKVLAGLSRCDMVTFTFSVKLMSARCGALGKPIKTEGKL